MQSRFSTSTARNSNDCDWLPVWTTFDWIFRSTYESAPRTPRNSTTSTGARLPRGALGVGLEISINPAQKEPRPTDDDGIRAEAGLKTRGY